MNIHECPVVTLDGHRLNCLRFCTAILITASILCMPFSLGEAEAHKTVLISVGESVKVGQYALEKGEKVVYSYQANGAVLFTVVAHLELPGYPNIPIPLVADGSMHTESTFEAPFAPSDDGVWVYEFNIMNIGFLSVEVTYDLHKVTFSALTIFLILLAVIVPVVVIFLAYAMSKRAG